MSLQVWLPLNGDLRNQGCTDYTITAFEASPTFTTGKIGQCYQRANTSSQITNGLQIQDNLVSTFGTAASVAVWVKPLGTHTHYNGTILSSGNWNAKRWTFGVSQDNSQVDVLCGGYNNYISCPVPVNQWTHLVSTFENGVCKLYKNGVYVGEKSGQAAFDSDANWTGICRETYAGGYFGFNGCINDLRIYDHCLSAAEVKEISQGLVLHYKLDGFQDGNGNPNLGNTSATYSNQSNGTTITASAWGGDAGTVTFYHSGGYNGLPYKIYHKTATGSGGIYRKTSDDIVIESGITYTMSCWIKADRQFTASNYSFNINRGVGNRYITYGSGFTIYTDWHYYSKTFTATDDDAGNYGEMSIIYDNAVTDYYVYYSGFKIEKGSVATSWCSPNASLNIIQDSSGYNHNGTINGTLTLSNDTPRYSINTQFPGTAYIKITSPSTEIKTVSLWAKWNSIPSGQSIIYVDQKSKTGLGLASNGILVNTNQSGNTFNKSNLVANTWYHFVIVSPNGSSNASRKLYINGVEQTALSSTNSWSYTIDELQLGKRSTSSDGFNGKISDFRMYCTALDADAIHQLYEVGAKVDNKGNLHAFELSESNNGRELLAVPLTTSYGNRTNIYTNYDANGEITLTGSSSIGSNYIKINPTGNTYYYDFEVSIDAGNQVYIGFERFDAAKTSRSNSACMYAITPKPSTALSHMHYHGTINIGTPFDANTPVDTIAVRILNDWSGAAAGRSMTVHKMSLREVSTLQNTKINKYGQAITTELIEMNDKFRVQKNGIIEANEFLEL